MALAPLAPWRQKPDIREADSVIVEAHFVPGTNCFCYGSPAATEGKVSFHSRCKNVGLEPDLMPPSDEEGQMLIIHLLTGIVFGALAAGIAGLMGFSFDAIVGCYILVGNLGLLASIPAALLMGQEKAPQLTVV